MADDTTRGMGARDLAGNTPGKAAERHVYGPRLVGALVPTVTRAAFKAQAPGVALLMSDWSVIVGPRLASVTTPRRLSGGSLTLACAGPVAMELQHLSEPLIERINGHLGRVLVQRLRFVQDVTPPPAPVTARPRRATVAVQLPGIPPGDLRDALLALGQSVGQPRSTRDDA